MDAKQYTDTTKKAIPIEYYLDPSYNSIRISHVMLIGCCMRNYKPFSVLPIDDQETYIRRLERSCYNSTIEYADDNNIPCNWHNELFIKKYTITTYKVQANLIIRDSDSNYLMDNLISKSISAISVGKMKSRQLCPSKSKHLYDIIDVRKKQRIIKKYSKQYKCGKCGKRKTTFYEKQLRSLDEGSTLFITCAIDNCGNSWSLST